MLFVQAHDPLTSRRRLDAASIVDGVVWERHEGPDDSSRLDPLELSTSPPTMAVVPFTSDDRPNRLGFASQLPGTHRVSPVIEAPGKAPSWPATLNRATFFLEECQQAGQGPTLVSLPVDFATLCSRSACLDLVRTTLTLPSDGVYCLFDLDPVAEPSILVFGLANALWICFELSRHRRTVWVGQAGTLGPLFRSFRASAFGIDLSCPFRTCVPETRGARRDSFGDDRILVPGLLLDVPTSLAEQIARDAPEVMRCPGVERPARQSSSPRDRALSLCLSVMKVWDRAPSHRDNDVDELLGRLDRAQSFRGDLAARGIDVDAVSTSISPMVAGRAVRDTLTRVASVQ
jgi:hypothetical protein